MMNRGRGLWVLSIVMTVVTMTVIFSFSGQSAAESSALSGGIAAKLLPFVQAVLPGVTADGLHHFLRKLAHFTIYFVLGCALTGDFSVQHRVPPILCAILTGGLFAASDEFHQFFSEGRAPSVQDVFLDTCGVAAGSFFLFCFSRLFWKSNRQNGRAVGERAA